MQNSVKFDGFVTGPFMSTVMLAIPMALAKQSWNFWMNSRSMTSFSSTLEISMLPPTFPFFLFHRLLQLFLHYSNLY